MKNSNGSKTQKLKAPKSQPAFGRWLRTAFLRCGKNQLAVADDIECSKATLSGWSKGRAMPIGTTRRFIEIYFDTKVPLCDYCEKKHVDFECPAKAKDEKKKSEVKKVRGSIVNNVDTFTTSGPILDVNDKNKRYVASQPILDLLGKQSVLLEDISRSLKILNDKWGA